jgi:hypothetical protein
MKEVIHSLYALRDSQVGNIEHFIYLPQGRCIRKALRESNQKILAGRNHMFLATGRTVMSNHALVGITIRALPPVS